MFGYCKHCGQNKPVIDFYRSDRHKCKDCVRRAVRENRQAKLDYYRAFDRQRTDDPDRVAARHIYRQTHPRTPEQNKEYRERYAIERQARWTADNAIRDGRLIPQACQRCGYGVGVQAHHEDYSNPLDVIWLCRTCHGARHREINQERRKSA